MYYPKRKITFDLRDKKKYAIVGAVSRVYSRKDYLFSSASLGKSNINKYRRSKRKRAREILDLKGDTFN